MKTLLVFLAAICITSHSESQAIRRLPAPINTPHSEWYPVLLPDSSLLLASDRKGNGNAMDWRAYRFIRRNGEWVESPSQLDSMINSTAVQVGQPTFQFSADFTMVFVTHHDGDDNRFFESHLVDGRWQPFVEIFQGNPKKLWHGITVMPDHRTAFSSDREGTLFTFYKTDDGWTEPVPVEAFKHVINGISDPVAFGVNSLLFVGRYQPDKRQRPEQTYFISKMIGSGKWSAPVKVDGMHGNYVSLCWNRESYLLASELPGAGYEIGVAPLPQLIRSEMAVQGQSTGGASFLQSQLIRLGTPINTNRWEMYPVLLPDSSLLLASNRKTTSNTFEYRAYRFVKRNGAWVESPSQLDSMINSATLASGVPGFHFSPDFSMLVVKMQAADFEVRFFETHFVDGRWKPLEEFFVGNPKKLWGGLAVMQDHQTVFATNSYGELFTFHKTDVGWSEPVVVDAFHHVIKGVEHLVAIGETGLMFNGEFVQSKGKRAYFFSKMTAPGKWIAPMELDGVGGFHVTPCWNRQSFLLASKFDDSEWDIRVAPLPALLRREMVLQAPRTKSPPAVAVPATAAITTTPVAPGGRYFAVLIGNADYKEDKLDLVRPTQDVEKMFACLSSKYSFDEKNIVRIVNADRNTILRDLYTLRQKVNPSDNVLIFYAGHGYWDEHIKQGYWWPSDADPENPATWISNSDLREQIRGLKALHTLLISDACFSGGIFRTRGAEDIRNAGLDIMQLYRLPSRRAITSGTLTSVPDESVFLNYMLKTLNENQEKYLPSTQLFTSFRRAVMNNSLTTPQDGVILDAGDEGGDFVFIRE